MTNNGMSQEEIDRLLKGMSEPTETVETHEKSQIDLLDEEKEKRRHLTKDELDVLGELGNISFGSASTVLSSILNKRVSITTPEVEIIDESQLSDGDTPHVVLNVNYIKGLNVENTLVIKKEVALYIADVMMMGDGNVPADKELTEMELSAVQEAMNQMMGSSATAMSQVFETLVDITPPTIKVEKMNSEVERIKKESNKVVRISFNLEIGENIKSTLFQIISISNAKEMADSLLKIMPSTPEQVEDIVLEELDNKEEVHDEIKETEVDKIRSGDDSVKPLMENVLVNLELVFGKTKKTLKEVLVFERNDVIELAEEIDEPMKLYANGILIAEGKLLNVDGYYGMEIKRLL